MAISYSDYKKVWKDGIGKEIDKINTSKKTQNITTTKSPEERKKYAIETSTPIDPIQLQINTEKKKKEEAYNNYKNNTKNNVSLLTTPVLNKNQNRLNELATRQEFEKTYDNTKINNLIKQNNTYEDKLTLGKIGKTAGNIATNMAIGTGRAIEGFVDWSMDMSNKVNDGIANKLGIITDKEYANSRKNTRDFISRNLVNEGLEKLGWDDEMYNKWEKDSFVKRDNIGGEIAQGIGGMFPSLLVGNAAGLNASAASASYKSLKGLTLGQKILTGATNVGKGMLYSLPTNTTLGLKVYGSALEEAYNAGATDSEAAKYAIATSAKEIATEWLTSGIPGLEQTGLLDKGADFLIDKATGKITEEATKGIVKSLLKAGYEMVGEGLEEGISEILTPIIKNATYSEGEQIDWGAVVNSIIVGSITGGILNVPSTIYNVKNVESTPSNSNNKLQNNNQLQTASINELNNQNVQTTMSNNNQVNLPDNSVVNDNIQIDKLNFVESAKLYNLDSNNQVILRINELLDNRGIIGRFDGTKFNDTSIDAYWSIDKNGNRSVIFNPRAKTQNYIQNVAIHELTHDLLSSKNTGEILNTKEILEYISTKDGYIEARNSLIKDYSKVYDQNSSKFQNLIDEEVIASVFGNKLGTQEFVDQLVYEKPSLAKRIYNWIVDKLNSLVNSGKIRSERLYWENIRNKFEKSYKMEYNNINKTHDVRFATIKNNPYKHTSDFVKLSQKIQSDAHKVISPKAAEYAVKGKDFGVVTDINGNIYYFDVLNEGNYRVVKVLKYGNIVEEVADETSINENRKYSMASGRHGQGNGDRNIESVGNEGSSERVSKPSSAESRKQTSDENRQIAEKSNRNRELDNSSFFNTKYSVSDISSNDKRVINAVDVTNYKTNYENVPDNLLGFRKQGQNKGFDETKFPYTLDLLISVDGGKTYFEDSIKGMNYKQAIEIAKRNWEGSILKVKDTDAKHSLSETPTTDNQGRKLSKQQQEFFKDSKAVDEEGNLITVYHTMTNSGQQFNEFNPVGTDYYRFGDQVVNYYTDDKEMSGSYADQDYVMADTKKTTSMTEVNKLIKEVNKNVSDRNKTFKIESNDGKYELIDTSNNELEQQAIDYTKTLSDYEKEIFKDITTYYRNESYSDELNIDSYLLNRGYKYGSQEDIIAQKYLHDIYNKNYKERTTFLDALNDNLKQKNIVKTFENQNDLFRNLKNVINEKIYYNSQNYQYEGYINITKPYIIDAEGRNWNKIESKKDSSTTEKMIYLDTLTKDRLIQLAKDSQNRYNVTYQEYKKWLDAVNSIDGSLREKNPLEIRSANRIFREVLASGVNDFINNDYKSPINANDESLNELYKWRTNNDIMRLMDEWSLISVKEYEQFQKTLEVPENARQTLKKLANTTVNYNEYDKDGRNPIEKQDTLYNVWNKHLNSSKEYSELGRYEYSIFDNQLLDGYLEKELKDYFPVRDEFGVNDNNLKDLFKVSLHDFDENYIRSEYNEWSVTNDIVKQILELNKFGENYDGVIIKNTVDYGGKSDKHDSHDLYVTFNSNQFKAVDNIEPTKDDDIRYSQKTNSWQNFVDENFKSKGTGQTISDLKVKDKVNINISDGEDNLKNYIIKKSELLLKEIESSEQNKKVSNNLKLFLENGVTITSLKNALTNIVNNPIEPNTSSHIEKTIRSKLNNDYDLYVKKLESKNKTKTSTEEKVYRNTETIKTLQQQQKAVINRLEQKIKAKEDLYNSKKNKDTKLAQQLQQQIILLNNQKNNRQIEYDQRINRLSELNENLKEKMETPEFKTLEQRLNKVNEYRDLAYNLTENMIDWKDKKRGLSYQINTMKRNLYDIMSEEDANKMYNTYFKPITENNAKIEKFINSYNERIKKLELNNIESTAVQMLGEYKYNKETLITGREVNEYIEQNKLDYKKLTKAVNEFRSIYDELIVKTNEVLIEQGFKPIEYRKGYFPHFIEEKADSKIGKVLEKLGFKIKKDQLPTDIAGITDTFKPGKTWFRNAQRRIGRYTDYNALKGFDAYIRGAADTIFHTEDIQKLRALENVIRYQYTDQSIQDRIEEITNDEFLNYDEKTEQINEVIAKFKNPLGNFVTEIKNYTDSIANKKNIGDRAMEHALGREAYSIMTNVQSRVSANQVAFNISSALTNFIPLTQAYSQISTKNMLKAIRESISAQHKADSISSQSTFLTNRNNKAERLYKTNLEKINDKGSIFFESVDDFTSNVIVRGKLYENLDKGMSYDKALQNADEFAKDIMAGRDKGSMPTIFNRKNPIVKLFTAFQLEVNNQYGYMLKDLPRDKRNEGLNKLVAAFIKMFLGSWLYNKFAESVTGRKSAFSPIDLVEDAIKTTQNDNLNTFEKLSAITSDTAEELPFIGGLLGGGRLPISGAIPSISSTTEAIINLADDKKRKNAIKTITKELSKPLFYIVPPFGGGQLKKTIEGASMYINKDIPGSYTTSGRLRFEADKSISGVAKSLIFGQYASKNAKEYFEKGYLPLTEKQQKEIKELGITVKEYRKYREDYSKINKIKADKNEKDRSIPGSAAGKKAYAIMQNKNMDVKEKNYLLSTISNNSIVNVDMLNKLEQDEEVYKYFYSLNNENREEFIDDLNKYNFDSNQLYEYYQYRSETKEGYVSVIAKQRIADYLLQSDLTDEQRKYLYLKEYGSDTLSKTLSSFNVSGNNYINVSKYITKLKDDFSGDRYSDYRKQATFNYINGLNATMLEKIVLFKVAGYSISSYKNSVFNYINSLNLTKAEKEEIFNYLY